MTRHGIGGLEGLWPVNGSAFGRLRRGHSAHSNRLRGVHIVIHGVCGGLNIVAAIRAEVASRVQCRTRFTTSAVVVDKELGAGCLRSVRILLVRVQVRRSSLLRRARHTCLARD